MFDLNFLYENYHSRQETLTNSKSSLVHYTGLDGALGILENQSLWFRKITLMNDHSEFSYGQGLIAEWANKNKAQLAALSAKLNFDFFKLLSFKDSQHWEDVKANTYSLSMSEHLVNEDELGRLSMWRGYGSCGGVALIVNPDFLKGEDVNSSAHPLPVRYWEMKHIDTFLGSLGYKIYNLNRSNFASENFADEIYFGFLQLLMSIKHPGFHEEREWRLVANPKHLGMKLLSKTTVDIHNCSQDILCFDLKGGGMYNMKNLLKKVIIGPSKSATESANKISEALQKHNLNIPVSISNIPFRVSW